MLNLTRKIGEKIVISDNVICTVLGIKGNQVCLGFDAPRDVAINREEIHLKIKQQKEAGIFGFNHEKQIQGLHRH